MGGGSWNPNLYDDMKAARKARGVDPFAYSINVTSRPHDTWASHADMNPLGVKVRESRDSDEHPESNAVAVMMDVTGSMSTIPRQLQEKLKGLLSLLVRKGYVSDPQVLFGAIGDAYTDMVPLQVGQFESDNRMDDQLRNLVLEGGGGGQSTESYELAMYFMAKHTSIDCWEKRGRKGYLFMIGDEAPYGHVNRKQVKEVIGDDLGENLTTEALVAELKKRYNVFYIMPSGASHSGERDILNIWKKLLGQNVLELADLDAVCETIALTIGICEGTIDLDDGVDDLKALGVDGRTIRVVSTAVAKVSGGVVAKGSASIPPTTTSSSNRRL